jgi:hypothetical protein
VRIETPVTSQITGTAVVENWQPRRVQLKIDSSRESQLTINHFYYEGWQGRIKGAKGTLIASPSPEGFIQLNVPPGGYELVLEFPKERAERAGGLLSLLSAVLLGSLIGRAWWLGRSKNGSLAALVMTNAALDVMTNSELLRLHRREFR